MSKDKRDYYDVLDVPRDADEKTIKRAYRKRAMKLHPDQYDGPKEEAEEKFKELNEAYSVLSDPKQRQLYDQFGFAGVDEAGAYARSADPFDFFSSIFNFDLSDLFGSSFGGARTRRRSTRRGPRRGDDVVLDLELSYEEAYDGISKKVTMPFYSPCEECKGSRTAKGSGYKTCPKCRGSGSVEHQVQQGFFVQITREPCDQCRQSGRIPEKKCPVCKGSGQSKKREKINVKIPRGIRNGEAVRVQGKGRPSNDGGMPGDLIFRIHLKKHPVFKRNNNDVYVELPVNYPTMALGGQIEVPVIHGKDAKDGEKTSRLKIPKGTKLNDVLRIQGAGFQRDISGTTQKGDMYYVITLDVPKRLSKKQKELLKQLQETM